MRLIDLNLSEALPLSTAKTYRKAWDPSSYKDLFSQYTNDPQAFRIYIPLEASKAKPKVVKAPADILKAVEAIGFTIEDYVNGIAAKGLQKIKLGKVLQRIDPKLKQKFDSDPKRQAQNKAGTLQVVISRHPYDVAGMSTDRGWGSCMSLTNGSNRKYVMRDVKGGTIVAYLIDESDKNIWRPKARLLIKPFVEKTTGEVILIPEGDVYGTAPANFAPTVQKWLDKVNDGKAAGLYCLKPGLYNDGMSSDHMHGKPEKLTVPQLKHAIENDHFQKVYHLVKDNPKMLLYAVQTRSSNIKFIKNPSVDFIIQAAKIRPSVMQYVNAMKLDADVILKLIKQNPHVISFIKKPSVELQMIAVKKLPELVNDLTPVEDTVLKYVLATKPMVILWENFSARPDIESLVKYAMKHNKAVGANPNKFLMNVVYGIVENQEMHLHIKFMKKVIDIQPKPVVRAMSDGYYNKFVLPEIFDHFYKKHKSYLKELAIECRLTTEQSMRVLALFPDRFHDLDLPINRATVAELINIMVTKQPSLIEYLYTDLTREQIARAVKANPKIGPHLVKAKKYYGDG